MKTVSIIAGIAMAVTVLVGCVSETVTPDTADKLPDMANVPSFMVHLQDGGELKCIYITQDGIYGGTGGPTCWENK